MGHWGCDHLVKASPSGVTSCPCRKPLLLCKYSIMHPVLYKTSYEYVSSVFWIDTYGWNYWVTVQTMCIYQCPEVYGKFSFSCFCIFPNIWCSHLFVVAQACIVVCISGSLIFFSWILLGISGTLWGYALEVTLNFFASLCFHEVGALYICKLSFLCVFACVYIQICICVHVLRPEVNIACLQSLFSLVLEIFSWTWSSLALLD